MTQANDYWVGATAVVRSSRWRFDSNTITDSTQSTHRDFTWGDPLPFGNAPEGYGYYLEAASARSTTNLSCCVAGEYFIDSDYLYVGLADGQTPAGKTIEASSEAIASRQTLITDPRTTGPLKISKSRWH